MTAIDITSANSKTALRSDTVYVVNTTNIPVLRLAKQFIKIVMPISKQPAAKAKAELEMFLLSMSLRLMP